VPSPNTPNTLRNVTEETMAVACPISVGVKVRATTSQKKNPPIEVTIVDPINDTEPTKISR
jgi:hypothetical protein